LYIVSHLLFWSNLVALVVQVWANAGQEFLTSKIKKETNDQNKNIFRIPTAKSEFLTERDTHVSNTKGYQHLIGKCW